MSLTRRSLTATLLAAALAPVAAAAPPPSLATRARADELAAARATWARQHLADTATG